VARPPSVEVPAGFGSALAGALGRRRAALEAQLPQGRVLDLGTAAGRALLAATPALPQIGQRYDVVVSVVGLVHVADLPGALAAVGRALAPTGELWLVEPVARPGALATATATMWSFVPALAGLHLARDVPAAVRASGLTITDLERFTMPTPHVPLRPFVQLRAARFEEVGS
jgi:SAM-dependent methyltransferase